jgi:hypothetical protein
MQYPSPSTPKKSKLPEKTVEKPDSDAEEEQEERLEFLCIFINVL